MKQKEKIETYTLALNVDGILVAMAGKINKNGGNKSTIMVFKNRFFPENWVFICRNPIRSPNF